jgi:hypothetical protein
MTSHYRRICAVASIAGLGAIAAGQAHADFSLGVRTGLGYTDNVTRVRENGESESLATLGLRFGYDEHTAKLNADARANLSYVEYLGDSYSGEIVGGLSGKAQAMLIEDRLGWTVQDEFNQSQINAFGRESTDNRENVNLLETGPDLLLNLGNRNHLDLSARYGNVWFEKSDVGSSRYAGNARISHDVSPQTSVGISYKYEHVDFQSQTIAALSGGNYDRQEVQADYIGVIGRTDFSMGAGYSTVDSELTENPDSSVLAHAALSRRVSPSSRLSLGYDMRMADVTENLRDFRGLPGAGPEVQPIIGTTEAFRQRSSIATWSYAQGRTGVDLTGAYSTQRYEINKIFNRTYKSASLDVRRQLGPRLSVDLRARWAKAVFPNADFDNTEFVTGAELVWQFGKSLRLGARAEHFDRNCSNPVGEFKETQFWLSAEYHLGRDR